MGLAAGRGFRTRRAISTPVRFNNSIFRRELGRRLEISLLDHSHSIDPAGWVVQLCLFRQLVGGRYRDCPGIAGTLRDRVQHPQLVLLMDAFKNNR